MRYQNNNHTHPPPYYRQQTSQRGGRYRNPHGSRYGTPKPYTLNIVLFDLSTIRLY